jgi:uncharacterized protein (TIGR02646 family)
MIPVQSQPEPDFFDAEVRIKGLAHLKAKGYALAQPLPNGAAIASYWRGDCLTALHRAYGGVCAYLCVFVERCTGGMSVDHFVAKSALAGLAYEWSNYRLACSIMNSRKREFDDVLDPFELASGWFHLELITGHVFPNPALEVTAFARVAQTIERLGLDEPLCREMRVRWLDEYLTKAVTEDFLRRKSPFVWAETHRQGLLLHAAA